MRNQLAHIHISEVPVLNLTGHDHLVVEEETSAYLIFANNLKLLEKFVASIFFSFDYFLCQEATGFGMIEKLSSH